MRIGDHVTWLSLQISDESPAANASGAVVSGVATPMVTRQYQFPPACLTAPPAEACSSEQLLEFAAQACRSASSLWALQGSPEHLRRICELLGALNQRAAAQEIELEGARTRLGAVVSMETELEAMHARLKAVSSMETELEAMRARRGTVDAMVPEIEGVRAQIGAAARMLAAARDQTASVRRTLCAEVTAHRATKLQADQEHELRIAAEEELRVMAGKLSREGDLRSRATQLCAQLSAEAFNLRHQLAGTTPAAVQVALGRDSSTRENEDEDEDEDEDETTVVDVPLVEEAPHG